MARVFMFVSADERAGVRIYMYVYVRVNEARWW